MKLIIESYYYCKGCNDKTTILVTMGWRGNRKRVCSKCGSGKVKVIFPNKDKNLISPKDQDNFIAS